MEIIKILKGQHLALNKKVLGICIILITCLSCQQREVFFEFESINNQEWSKTDTLLFKIDSGTVVANTPYLVTFELVSNVHYPYQNLWLSVQDNFGKDSTTVYSYHYMLADDFGNWYGSGFGSIYQLPLSYKKGVVFAEQKDYWIRIVHAMRDEPLKGIEKLGLKVEKEID